MIRKIVSNRDYVAGWLDCSIPDFLEVLAADAARPQFALITCLDSNPNPASLRTKSPELKSIANRLEVIGTSLLVETELLLEANTKRQIFFGFDEVWLFPSKTIEPKPPAVSVVGPARINRARFNRMVKWMSDNSCSMALGGGEGLNFVVRAQGLARSLLGYSIEQPEPSLASI